MYVGCKVSNVVFIANPFKSPLHSFRGFVFEGIDMNYMEFLRNKEQSHKIGGFEPLWMPEFLFDFQKDLVNWAITQGRCAKFADCGLGKTPMQLVWSENVVRKTNGKVLIIAPLAVSSQTCREGEKFGIEVKRSRDGQSKGNITITNYEQLSKFDWKDFDGIVCDESSAIKQFNGVRKRQVVHFMRKTPYRYMCTATASPNDYTELGTHSEALGVMGQMDMIDMFFKSTDNMQHARFKTGDFWNKHKFMFKAFAKGTFWQWVSSWARAIKKPSDFGYSDEGYELPKLNVVQHVVKHNHLLPGEMFPKVAKTFGEQQQERKMTLKERCEKVAELCEPEKISVVWCHTNMEGDYLDNVVPNSVQIKGSDKDDYKEEAMIAFANGEIKVLITKPKISGFGMNWQHCNHTTFFPSHSYEQYYQAVRRFWRFGQTKPVKVDIVTTEGEAGVTANLKQKAIKSDEMFRELVDTMYSARSITKTETFDKEMELPSWL